LSHSSPFYLALHTFSVVPFLLKKYGELGRKEKNGTTEKVWRARKKGEKWEN
jgi:hypothetical protein